MKSSPKTWRTLSTATGQTGTGVCRFGKGKKVGVAAVARERQRLGEESCAPVVEDSLSDINGQDIGHQHRGVLLLRTSASESFHPKELEEGRLVSRFGRVLQREHLSPKSAKLVESAAWTEMVHGDAGGARGALSAALE